MKKLLSVFMLAAMVLAFAGMASATPICATFETTFVSGTITDATNGDAPVSGATVDVTCNGHLQTTTSAADGGYEVQFDHSDCSFGDSVSVSATSGSLTGNSDFDPNEDWYTETSQIGCLELIVDVACANVPLVPEFLPIIAMVTALGALGVFFVVRRK